MKVFFQIILLLLKGRRPEARSLAMRKSKRILKRYFSLRKHTGVDIMKEEWDYLLVLDACRYDYFEKIYTKYLQGDLSMKVSRGTSSSEWLNKNFREYYEDTVYVSGNPHCSDHEIHGFLGTKHFHKIDHVWKYAWSEDLDTVTPEPMVEATLKMKKAYPNKRMIVHFIQPHGPWIGKTKISVAEMGTDPTLKTAIDGKWTVDTLVWEAVRQGKFDVDKLRQAYMDNLELVLEHVQGLVAQLDGKIVITADHGEAFGEKFIVDHPPGVYIKELTDVPWLVIDKGPKKKVEETAGEEVDLESPEIDDDKLAERLKALGYVE